MNLTLLTLQFVIRSQGMIFAGFPGAAWHGGLGMMLQRLHPQVFSTLYSVAPESRLYALFPQHDERIEHNETALLRITLFGEATKHALAVCEAISALGQVGMRPGGKFDVQEVHSLTVAGWQAVYRESEGLLAPPQAQSLVDLIAIALPQAQHLRLDLCTPLRIKDGNQLLRTPPSFSQFIRRMLGRLEQLAFATDSETPIIKSRRDAILAEAAQVSLSASAPRTAGLERRSARSGQRMVFDGMEGELQYTGQMTASLPLVLAATLVQVGGKTAFGFGAMEIVGLE